MKVETEVSAFVVRKDMVIPYKTLETAAREVDEYDFMRICDGHYICKHKDTAYLIIVDGDRIGCSCASMTFHCKGNDGCKHLAAFSKRSEPQKPISDDIAMELIKAGWTGEPGNMTPPDTADAEHEALIDSAANAGWSKEHPEMTSDEDGDDNGGGDPVPPDAEKPEPPEKVTVTCQYCMKRATRNSQAEADEWLESHPCKDRPRQKKQADSEPPLGAKMYSRTCPHCNERFDGTDLDEVKDRHRDHIPICPENPANKPKQTSDEETVFECQYCGSKSRYQATIESHETICPMNPVNKQQQPSVSSKTELTETPPEQKPIVKESLTPETQPEQKEETKMEQNTTTPETAVAVAETPKNTAMIPDREMPSDAEMQRAQVARILQNQGSIYKVGQNRVPDSAAVSNLAISEGISTETIKVEQTKEYALAIVRAHKGSRYVDASVLIRKDAIVEKTLIDLAERNPKWILGWAHGLPDFDLNQLVHIGDKRKILGLHIAGLVSDAWMFAPRNCETKAGRRAQVKILGSDWRETDEVADEQSEVNAVAKR